MVTVHELRIEQHFLDALLDGTKTFEVRLNDRGYQKGDLLVFWDLGVDVIPTPRRWFKVTYVHSGLGMEHGYVVLGVQPYTKADFELRAGAES